MDAGVEVGEGTAVGGDSLVQDKLISTSNDRIARAAFMAGTPLQNRIVTTCHSDQNPRKPTRGHKVPLSPF